ncbi:patatin-like phospholipase family protein [Mycobacterium sp. KBS0706]|uniref:patatin-like phospholipase family protein n=1 Tax=Mycobacterium sp. KBS0706 TaxID=2578109 RepID=UPI00163D6271|nr:patatin-like phospholipase family protein [Mycobacterium sp. KBS0706]
MARAPLLWALALALTLTACAYPERNRPLETYEPHTGYRWSALSPTDLPDTLVLVSASGGGTRATALTMSVLQGMDQVRLPSGRTLAHEVDAISSVSGGSVAAAYFAWKGPEGLGNLESKFVRQDGISAMLWDGANPVGLAELSTPGKERIDLLIDYLDQQLFKDATFAGLAKRSDRPFLILNAADMVEGLPFPFTQDNFDLICSDLAAMKLSTAVAASAAFPVALSPVTLRNYSPCKAQPHTWPPEWVTGAAHDKTWYQDEHARVIRGRAFEAYALGQKAGKDYIHLLDGGIADNLGLIEPMRLVSTNDTSLPWFSGIAQGRIKRLILVVINARSDPASDLDHRQATPGILDMLTSVINSGIDNTSNGTISALGTLLADTYREAGHGLPPPLARNFEAIANNIYVIPVDLDAIGNDKCRLNFQSIGTSWTLSRQQIDALMLVGPALLAAAPDFNRMTTAINAHLAKPLPSLDQACATVPQAG